MKRFAVGQIVSALLLGFAVSALAQSGGGYDLSHNVIGHGGGTFSTAGSNTLSGTAGQPDAGALDASPYTALGGFWGVPSTPLCGNGVIETGEQCDDGSANGTTASCCTATCQFTANGTGCDDGNSCTQTDRCDGSGRCVGSDPVVCATLDQCHVAGTCDPVTGACSNPPAPDGTTCNAGNACAQPDTCQLGTCIATQCATGPVAPGGTVTTDTANHGATPAEPMQTSVTSPVAGTISITETAASGGPPAGFSLVGEQVTISSPAGTPDAPLVLVFVIDASRIPPGSDQNSIHVFKDAVEVAACTGSAGTASPDPCVSDRALLADGDVRITVLTSTTSLWTFAVSSAVCGDGVVESGEQCDDGSANGTLSSCCNTDCTFKPNGAPCDDGDPTTCRDQCTGGVCGGATCPVADAVVLPLRPLNVTLRAGNSSVAKTVRVIVRNASAATQTIQLVASAGDCPAGTLAGLPDFDTRTAGAQGTVSLAAGRSKTAVVPLAINSANFTNATPKAPTRCTLRFTANVLPEGLSYDPTSANNTAILELNVLDGNDTGGALPHETYVRSVALLSVSLRAGVSAVAKTARLTVGNGDVGETLGHSVSVTASDGDCPAGTVGAVDLDLRTPGAQNTATVRGGMTKAGALTVTVHAEAFSTPNGKAPARCTALITATGPAGDTDASNNTTKLVIDIMDRNDF